MALRQTKKISELPALSPASLDTTFVVGISGSTTYKISINQLTSSLDTTFATDLVTAALSSNLDGKLSTSSFNSYTASITTSGTISSSAQITSLGFISSSISLVSLNSYTASQDGTNIAFTNGINGRLTTSSFNSYTASQSTSSLVNRLNAIESVSGSWITESETGSFLTSLSGAISSSSQLTSSYDTRYTLSGSVQPLPSNLLSSSAQITAFGFISSSTTIPAGTISGSLQLTSSFDLRYLLTGSVTSSITQLNSFTSSLNIWTSSVATTGSNNFIGNQTITGSLTITGSAKGNIVPITIASSTASLDMNAGSYFTLTLANNVTTHIRATNITPGMSATLLITTGTNSTASLAPTLLQPSGSAYSASIGVSKKDVLSLVAFDSTNMYVVSTKAMQ